MNRTGRLFVLSAPSGSGKTTLLDALLKKKIGTVVRSISATTRPPRKGERNGRDYLFYSRDRFLKEIKRRGFLEHARILSNWYGTPRGPVERALRSGKDVALGLDIQGARQLKNSGLPVTTIFLLPPSLEELGRRLNRRGTETPAQIRARLKLARRELREVRRYDYAVVNDRLEDAIHTVRAILRAERHRVHHSGGTKKR